MDYIAPITSILALILGVISLKRTSKYNIRSLELELTKLYSDIGTLEDLSMEKKNLEIEHQENNHQIVHKWTKWQHAQASDLARRGISDSSFAEDMKREAKESNERELRAEQRDYELKLQKLSSREKLIRESVDKISKYKKR